MNILADTHILLWALGDNPKLSQKGREILLSKDNKIFYSMINVWEIAVKHETHPDQMKYSAKLFEKLCQEAGYFSIEGKIKHVIALESLKRADDAPRHRDPFDKILLAQAKSEEMAFLTHDGMMMYYNENCIIKI